jgi:hypothetical protein
MFARYLLIMMPALGRKHPARRDDVGCFGDDPFAAFIQLPVYMVSQQSNPLIPAAFELPRI